MLRVHRVLQLFGRCEMSAAARTAAYSGLALALKEALARWQRGVPMAADERGRVYSLVPHAVSMVGHFRPDVDAHPGGEEVAGRK